tara:strand:- start:824 stop:1045 length:222 start_codon:yes stop_codon:yes gene_type:complete
MFDHLKEAEEITQEWIDSHPLIKAAPEIKVKYYKYTLPSGASFVESKVFFNGYVYVSVPDGADQVTFKRYKEE